jgi:RecB family exonuclease
MTTQFVTSVTDRGQFRDCRRRWHLETVQRLAPKSSVAYALEFGTVIHTGLEWYYRSGRDVTTMLDEFKAAWQERDDYLAREYGGLYTMGIEEEWWNHYILGEQMLRNYDRFDKRERWFDEVIEVNLEERSYVPIVGRTGRPMP